MTFDVTKVEIEVLAAVLASRLFRHEKIHEAQVIEGIEHRARVFDREVPEEAAIREAISALEARGELTRDAEGWLRRA